MQKSWDNLSIGILAGGKSTRMGQNKALLQINNETIIKRLTDELKGISIPFISAAQKGIYEEYSPRVVYDQNKDIGPMEGVRQVLMHADTEYVFVCAADMPFVNRELVEYMAGFISSDYDCYVIHDGERMQPLCAIYSKKLLPLIEELIAEKSYKLFGIISQARTKFIDLTMSKFDRKVVKNINTKEEYFEILKPMVVAVSGYKNSGKTWLIEKLINEFINDGYKVATIKHDGHDVLADVEGTDTDRFAKAGAVSSVAMTESRFVINDMRPQKVEELIDMISAGDVPDFVLLEGFKKSSFPKVEIVRKDIDEPRVCDPSTVICIATDDNSLNEDNVYDVNDVKGIFNCVKKYFGIE